MAPSISIPTPLKATAATTIAHPAQNLLSRAHSPTTTNVIFQEKVKNRPLYLRPSNADLTSKAPNARLYRRQKRLNELASQRRRIKPRPLSAKEKRRSGIHDLKKEEVSWDVFVPLWRLWVGYVQELLSVSIPCPSSISTPTPNSSGPGGDATGSLQRKPEMQLNPNFRGATLSAAALLTSADFHGAQLEVVRSNCVSRVGIKGIVVRDSKFAFRIVGRKNRLWNVPKEGTVFRLEIPLVVPAIGGPADERGGSAPDGKTMNTAERVKTEADEDSKIDGSSSGTAPSTEKEENAITERKLVFELHGEQFQHRAVDRANKKFKPHFLPDL